MSRISRPMLSVAVIALSGAGYLRLHAAPAVDAAQLVRPQASHTQTVSSALASSPASAPHALLSRYCFTCHNSRLKTAGLALDTLDTTNLEKGAPVWEKVVQKLRGGLMPPAGAPRPDNASYHSLASWLETELDKAAAAKPNAGYPLVHRLNRAEYANAVRDVLALEIDVQALLPADESGYGFDNIADVLSVTTGLLERYLLAATKISRAAVGDPSMRAVVATFTVSKTLEQAERVSEDLPLGSRGGIVFRHHFPVDGEYVLRIRLQRGFANGLIKGLDNRDQLGVYLDGARVKLFTIGGECDPSKDAECGTVGTDSRPVSTYGLTADKGLEIRMIVKAGPHMVGAAFIKNHAAMEGAGPDRLPAGSSAFSETGYMMGVDTVQIEGPFSVTGPGDTPSRGRIFLCRPSTSQEEEPCAKRILSTLARRAYRRPVIDRDVETLLKLYRKARIKTGFEAGIQFALEGLLASPHFLLRAEENPRKAALGTAYRISDLELASRLSFFLWSSIPDDELLDVAARGKLSNPQILEQQVQRMLGDARATTLVTNFASQWLYLKDLQKVAPDPWAFPDFDDSLRAAFREETELFLKSQLRENRSVVEVLTADYTFVNERLARFYGIPNVYGPRFRRVNVTDSSRKGLLGHASLLTVTSFSTRTSPVVRGRYILTNLLGSPIPPPPPDIPAFPEDEGVAVQSVRARMEQHRKSPACAVCHARMDPMGFALERFNAIGKWRDSDAGTPVDSSGTFPDGTKFSSPAEFREILLNRRNEFVHTVTEKLLTYALGRGIEYYDRPAIRRIVREAAADDYRWSSLILGIVKSTPFQMNTAQGEAHEQRPAPVRDR